MDELFRKEELEVLKAIIKEREAYNLFMNKIKSTWIWVIAGGVVTLLVLWEKIQILIAGAPK